MPFPFLPFSRMTRAAAAALLLVTVAGAESLLPPTPIPLETLAAFRAPSANWRVAGGIGGDPRHEKKLVPLPGAGVLLINPAADARGHLITVEEHGDAEVDVDFLLTPGSNSGVYLMGRYEVQLFDSWGAKAPTSSDCGGIYKRWDASRGKGNESYEGTAPLANASRAPGLWQHLHIEFQAPRFDSAGKKTANARFVKVVLNGFVVQENVDVTGPTRSAAFPDEAPTGPLMIQGDHGPVALRALAIKRFDATGPRVQVENLAYGLHPADSDNADSDNADKHVSAAPRLGNRTEIFGVGVVKKNGRFAVDFTGEFVIPRDGAYAFSVVTSESTGLTIDGRSAILAHAKGGQTEVLDLTAGRHRFRLDHTHKTNRAPGGFALYVEGPGLARQLLTAPTRREVKEQKSPGENTRSIPIEPTAQRIRMQRSFVPFDPLKRLYAVNVGSPAGIHYAYDFDTAAILRVWRGGFLDALQLWDGRAFNQLALPTGPALTLADKPVLALLESYEHDWPDQPDAMWSSQGYQLEPDGQPTFKFKLSTLSATDRIAPDPANHGLARTIVVTGKTALWGAWILLAEADRIAPQPDGRGYTIGDRSYYLDLPADSAIRPLLRTRNGKQQLLVPIDEKMLGKNITYSLVW